MATMEVKDESGAVEPEAMKELLQTIVPEGSEKQKSKPVPVGGQPTGLFICRDLFRMSPVHKYDQVFPGIYVGGQYLAHEKAELKSLRITHILNAAQGQKFAQIDTDAAYYADLGITFMGINAMDTSRCNLSEHFTPAAEFIKEAVDKNGRVFVHCFEGVSRSATLVLVYLMLHQQMTLPKAITLVRKKRAIFPNDGFIKQLCKLHNELFVSGSGSGCTAT